MSNLVFKYQYIFYLSMFMEIFDEKSCHMLSLVYNYFHVKIQVKKLFSNNIFIFIYFYLEKQTPQMIFHMDVSR